MKARLLIVAILCLWFFLVTGFSQQSAPPKFDFVQELAKLGTKNRLRTAWNGSLNLAIGMIVNPEIREGWGITDEQCQQIEDIQRGLRIHQEYRETPEYLKIEEEWKVQLNDLLMRNADKETRERKRLEFEAKIIEGTHRFKDNALDNLLTIEQKRKIREWELVVMSEMSLPTPNMFEALDITDTQKQQMEAIKKELEPEFERFLEQYANGIHNPPQGKALAMQLKVKMFDVLTDEQWDRLQELTDNPPEYAMVLLRKIRERQNESETTKSWQPGPDSWKPGDGIPEQYRQERNERRFPVRKVN